MGARTEDEAVGHQDFPTGASCTCHDPLLSHPQEKYDNKIGSGTLARDTRPTGRRHALCDPVFSLTDALIPFTRIDIGRVE